MKIVSVSRYLFKFTKDIVTNVTLHGFCDSSVKAYCAVVFIHYVSSDGVFSRLLASKTRVAPLRKLSVPRLELLSCLLLADLMSKIIGVLEKDVIIDASYYWSDSEVALSWVKNGSTKLQPWVNNRVKKIKLLSDYKNWNYVKTDINPADIGTREVGMKNLVNNLLWWYGPEFLRCDPSFIKNMIDDKEIKEEFDGELSEEVISMAVDIKDKFGVGNIMQYEKFSSLLKMLRIVGWLLRFITNCSSIKSSGDLTVAETDKAFNLCILWDQTYIVQDKKFANLKQQLSLFPDTNGILRLKGRLEQSHLTYDAKHPILLNKNSHLTKLIIVDAHERVKHMRVKATLNEIRTRFWICKGKSTVAAVIRDCVPCKRAIGKTLVGPPPPDLPSYRVAYEFAFNNIGIDYAGPLMVKDIYSTSTVMYKSYICLFTCAATRNVHLELCPGMDAQSLIRLLNRFIGRRGTFNMAVSDNFKTFIGKELHEFLTSRGIKWKHILDKSPWWGAFYERLIRIVKDALKKCLGNAKLSYEEMETVLVEVEAVINSRPLTCLTEEVDEALTPSHMVIGRRLLNQHESNTEILDVSQKELNARCKYLKKILDHYWTRFSREYLSELYEHHLYSRKGNYDEYCRLLLGDMVFIKDDKMKRNSWKKGVVEELICGRDNKVRGALLRVTNKKGDVIRIRRPIQKIVPLEVKKET